MKLSTILLAAALLAGCKSKKETTTPDSTDPGNTGDPGDTGGEPALGHVLLVSLTNGDNACYVEVDKDGEALTYSGSFDLCEGGDADATSKINQEVVLRFEKMNVLTDSCGGDPQDCPSEEVDGVVGIELANIPDD